MSSTRSPLNSRSIAGRAGRQRALARRLSEGAEHRVHRHRAAQRLEQIGNARGRDAVGGNAGSHRVGGIEPLAGERAIGAEFAGRRGRNQVAPTSGKKPIPTSGMANRKRSPATRCEPWIATPTPPPITMPSISAT